MSAVISKEDYVQLANFYASARDLLLGTSDDLFDAVYEVVLLQAIEPEVDLVNPLWNAYTQNQDITTLPDNFLSAVTAINRHVQRRAGLVATDSESVIDQFLSGSGLQVPQSWAVMSEAVGFPIDSSFVES